MQPALAIPSDIADLGGLREVRHRPTRLHSARPSEHRCAGPGQQDPVRLRPEAPRCCTTTAAVCPLQRATDLNAGQAGAVLGDRTRIGRLVYGYLVTVVAYSRSSLSDCPLHYYFVNRP